MTRRASVLAVSTDTAGAACVVTVEGILDSSTYLRLRDVIIKAALDEPRAVIVDVDALRVPASSAWSAFTSARWHVSTWPDVPIMLVCSPDRARDPKRLGVDHYVPIHTNIESALDSVQTGAQPLRRRARAELPASLASLRQSRTLVGDWLTVWSQPTLIPVATVILNVFVENVLQHTTSAPNLRLETDGTALTIAVQDCHSTLAARHEDPFRGGDRVSGLAIVAAVCRSWGCLPTPSGKTVWAVVGPENQL
jgi:hypothetical protein